MFLGRDSSVLKGLNVLESSGTSDLNSITPTSTFEPLEPTNTVSTSSMHLQPQSITFTTMSNEGGLDFTQTNTMNANDIMLAIANEPPQYQTKSDLQIELLRLQIMVAKREMYHRELTIMQLENSLNLSEDEKKAILDRCEFSSHSIEK